MAGTGFFIFVLMYGVIRHTMFEQEQWAKRKKLKQTTEEVK
jgi:hypothetical protein